MKRYIRSFTEVKKKKFYSNDDVEAMVHNCHNDAGRRKQLMEELEGCSNNDIRAISNTIQDGSPEYFDHYDSAVIDLFISAYENAFLNI